MKKIIFLISLGCLFLTSCSIPEKTWRRVEGKKNFQFTENLECKMLTSTDITKPKETLIFKNLSAEFPELELGEEKELLLLTPLQNDEQLIVLSSLSEKSGARMYFIEKQSGVIGMAVSPDRRFDPATEVAFRGNCLSLNQTETVPKED